MTQSKYPKFTRNHLYTRLRKRRKVSNKFLNPFNILKKVNPLLTTFLTIIMTILTGIAIYIAVQSLENSQFQFIKSNQMADSLFKIQLANSKELNDSLISQIHGLQEITKKQLRITDEQLKISIETFQEQLYSGRPKMIVASIKMEDSLRIIDGMFNTTIYIKSVNNGRRYADSLMVRSFLITPNFSFTDFRTSVTTKQQPRPLSVGPRQSYTHEFMPKFKSEYKDNFYLCFEISYFDRILREEFRHVYYHHYKKIGNEFKFYVCRDAEKYKLQNFINIVLKKINQPLFVEA